MQLTNYCIHFVCVCVCKCTAGFDEGGWSSTFLARLLRLTKLQFYSLNSPLNKITLQTSYSNFVVCLYIIEIYFSRAEKEFKNLFPPIPSSPHGELLCSCQNSQDLSEMDTWKRMFWHIISSPLDFPLGLYLVKRLVFSFRAFAEA